MSTRVEQKAKREEEILITALQLFTRKGYAATKTNEISKALQISEGLLFHYFKTKEILLDTLVDIALKESTDWTIIMDMEPIQYFEQVASSVLACLKEDEFGARFFMLIAQLKQNEGIPEHIAEKMRQQEENSSKFILEIIEKGQKQGTIRKGNPNALMNVFANTLQATAIQRAIHEEMDYPEVEWLLDLVKA